MTIYLGIIPTDGAPFTRLINLFFSQLVTVNIQQGLPENNPTLKYQCLLLMDEFTALGTIPAILHGVAYIAGYGLRLLIIIQTPSQVTQLYGKDGTRTFFTNFEAQIIYPPRDETDAEEYSKLVGYEIYKAKSTSRSSGRGSSRSQNQSDQRRAVMLPQEMKLMPQSDCIVLMGNTRLIYAKKIVYWQDPVFIKRANLPFWIVPALAVSTTQRIIGNKPVAQYMSDEAMATADARDVTNAADVFNAILRNLVTPDSSTEFVASISHCIQNNLDIDAMSIFKAVLNNS